MRLPSLFAFLALLVSCRPPLPASEGQAPSLEPKEIELTKGGPLVACTPTGIELCFNATDDNCNGVIDEGCGIPTGVLQFAIAWERGPDVDLKVTDPTGELARPGDKTATGFLKDRDCGSANDGCQGQNLENVHFEGDSPPRGRYRIEIELSRADAEELPVRVRFGARIGPRTYAMDLELRQKGEKQVVAFTL